MSYQEGRCRGKLIKHGLTKSKDGRPIYALEFEITGPKDHPDVGRFITAERWLTTDKAKEALIPVLEAVGYDRTIKARPSEQKQMIGKEATLVLKANESGYVEVSGVFSLDNHYSRVEKNAASASEAENFENEFLALVRGKNEAEGIPMTAPRPQRQQATPQPQRQQATPQAQRPAAQPRRVEQEPVTGVGDDDIPF